MSWEAVSSPRPSLLSPSLLPLLLLLLLISPLDTSRIAQECVKDVARVAKPFGPKLLFYTIDASCGVHVAMDSFPSVPSSYGHCYVVDHGVSSTANESRLFVITKADNGELKNTIYSPIHRWDSSRNLSVEKEINFTSTDSEIGHCFPYQEYYLCFRLAQSKEDVEVQTFMPGLNTSFLIPTSNHSVHLPDQVGDLVDVYGDGDNSTLHIILLFSYRGSFVKANYTGFNTTIDDFDDVNTRGEFVAAVSGAILTREDDVFFVSEESGEFECIGKEPAEVFAIGIVVFPEPPLEPMQPPIGPAKKETIKTKPFTAEELAKIVADDRWEIVEVVAIEADKALESVWPNMVTMLVAVTVFLYLLVYLFIVFKHLGEDEKDPPLNFTIPEGRRMDELANGVLTTSPYGTPVGPPRRKDEYLEEMTARPPSNSPLDYEKTQEKDEKSDALSPEQKTEYGLSAMLKLHPIPRRPAKTDDEPQIKVANTQSLSDRTQSSSGSARGLSPPHSFSRPTTSVETTTDGPPRAKSRRMHRLPSSSVAETKTTSTPPPPTRATPKKGRRNPHNYVVDDRGLSPSDTDDDTLVESLVPSSSFHPSPSAPPIHTATPSFPRPSPLPSTISTLPPPVTRPCGHSNFSACTSLCNAVRALGHRTSDVPPPSPSSRSVQADGRGGQRSRRLY